MAQTNPIFCPAATSIKSDEEITAQGKLMKDYACLLNEKVEFEKEITQMKLTNADLSARLKSFEDEFERTKSNLKEADESIKKLNIDFLTCQQVISNEKLRNMNIHDGNKAVIADLRKDLRIARKKLCTTNADLIKAERQVARYKSQCKDCRDKLRGFAILFTYFNDPKRYKSETFIPRSTEKLPQISSSESITSVSTIIHVEKNSQGVQFQIPTFSINTK